MSSFIHEKKINDITNKTSIKKKVLSPEEIYRNRRKPILPSDNDPDFTYGISTRSKTPLNQIISYYYGREFLKKQDENKRKEILQKKKLRREYYERMAAPANLLNNLAAKRVQKKEIDPRSLFKMKRFSHAQPKIDSWWSFPPGINAMEKMDGYDSTIHHPPPKENQEDESNDTIQQEILEECNNE